MTRDGPTTTRQKIDGREKDSSLVVGANAVVLSFHYLFIFQRTVSPTPPPVSTHKMDTSISILLWFIQWALRALHFLLFFIFSKPTFRPRLSCHFVFGLVGMPKPKPTPWFLKYDRNILNFVLTWINFSHYKKIF